MPQIRLIAILFATVVAGGALPGVAAEAPDAPADLPAYQLDADDINLGAPDVAAERVAALIDQLGDPEFEVREQASAELAVLCPYAFRALARAYQQRSDYETLLRIEGIVQEQYLWHTLLKQHGFLGVVYAADQLPDGSPAVAITRIAPDTAAEEAGLRAGDLVRGIGGEDFAPGAAADAFRERIQDAGAGGTVTLNIVRAGAELAVEVTLRARPLAEYNAGALVDELNLAMQQFVAWRDRHFGHREQPRRRTPSTAVLEIPE